MLTPGLMIALAIGGLFTCVILLIGTFRNRYSAEADNRLRSLANDHSEVLEKRTAALVSRNLLGKAEESTSTSRLSKLAGQLIPNSKADRQRQQSRLFQAGIYHPSALSVFFVIRLVLILIPPLVGAFAGMRGLVSMRTAMIIGSAIGGFGLVIPSFWLDFRISARHKQLKRSLPDFLDLMIVCLDGGLSLQGAIQRVSDEFQLAHPELALEMQTVQRDVDLGATVEGGLRNLAERTGLDSLRTLSTFLRESMRFGTELAEALRQHAEMLRVQREQAAEEQAQRAAVHILLPTLLLILPAVFVVVAGPAAIQIQEAFAKRSNK